MSGIEEASFQFLAEHSNDVICRAGIDLSLRYVSPSSSRVLGYDAHEMLHKRLDAFILSADAALLSPSLPSNLDPSPPAVRMHKKDGSLAWAEITHSVISHSPTGEPTEIAIVIRDITKCRQLEEQLSALELTDSHTGLATPRAFEEALENEWNRTLRTSSFISLLLLHFDHFRHFHDWRQHHEGDSCLAQAAAAVISALRTTDLAARYRTEDIAIILPGTSSDGAAKVAQKIRSAVAALRSPAPEPGREQGHVTLTMGLATVWARPGSTPHLPELLRLGADFALEKAKRNHPPLASALAP